MPISWVTVVWSMAAAACLTLAGVNLLVWYRQREASGNAFFAASATATAAMAMCELWMMRAATPMEWGLAGRWIHLPVYFQFIALVGFILVYLRAGRLWLAGLVVGLRTVTIILNFSLWPNVNFKEITRLQHISLLGEQVAIGEGVANPLMLIGQASLLLLVVFLIDATVTVWRRGSQRQALLIGASAVLFVLISSVQTVLSVWGLVLLPVTPSIFYVAMTAGMAYELSIDTLRAARLARDLSENEKRMNLAAEAAKMGVWTRDLKRNEIWATERWRDLFGFGPSETLDLERVLQRIHPHDRETMRQAWEQAIAGNGSYEREYRVMIADGGVRWISSRGRVEYAVDSTPMLMRGVSLDITERKQADAELRERRVELAHLSRVTMLGELSGSIAHELNQPLTAILSNAQAAQRYLVKDPPRLTELKEILEDIVEEDVRAGEVIKRLRLLLKKGEVNQEPLDANDVVHDVLRLARSDLANHGVIADTALLPGGAFVLSDRVQLQQVLLNLVMNACDAMDANEPKDRLLTLRTHRDGANGVKIEVSDVGRGLPPGSPEIVFERFFTTKPHGLGLGLSVCRTIIAAHGGTLGAANNAGRGATFYCNLPATEETNA
jgi:PAS domain S-box-containing protein